MTDFIKSLKDEETEFLVEYAKNTDDPDVKTVIAAILLQRRNADGKLISGDVVYTIDDTGKVVNEELR